MMVWEWWGWCEWLEAINFGGEDKKNNTKEAARKKPIDRGGLWLLLPAAEWVFTQTGG
jgi:hypothetical protein